MNKIIGINEIAMDNLILDINDRIQLCSQIMNEIEDCVDDTLNNYHSETKNKLQQKFLNLKHGFPILINNLETYSNDLVRAKNGCMVIDKIATSKVLTGGENLSIKEVK